MHLLAAQPGGFCDQEGIIDLGQDAAELVILSAADGSLAALAAAAEQLPADYPELRLANWLQLSKPAAFDLYRHKVLANTSIVVLSLLGGANYWRYGLEQLLAWQAELQGRTLIVVPGDDNPDPQLSVCCSATAEQAKRVWRYLREGGVDNSRQLLNFLVRDFAGSCHREGHDYRWREPQSLPDCLIYHPQHLAGRAALSHWQRDWRSASCEQQPAALLLFYRSHLLSGNTEVFNQLQHSLQRAGINALPVAVSSLKDQAVLAQLDQLIADCDAKLVLNSTGFASNVVGSPSLSSEPTAFHSPFSRPLPVLQLITASSSEQDWQQQSRGLHSRDIAMQVVLPEMDGRVITRAVSFKASSDYSERCQTAVVRYRLQPERAEFVATLASHYCRLSSKCNADKRIALILANYPTKDGRIGNGVGLDTPASTINILNMLQRAGYPLSEIPDDGDALLVALMGAVTNNPNTLHLRHCWQSLDEESYLRYFAELPKSCQRAVWDQWGQPSADPKYRDGRLMIAGIRLGECFVGIQPARGYNLDHTANYHSPDLIPPHSYLAFYFWLRHRFAVDAVIHVGKHGNLEWLPGKGTALSDQCWPDIALGPTPHFYPFIVNDPGEGAQAKRRAQAVIIDHLMPPMTRAESYGVLAQLESLVDEYYQALGMDARREQWLREKIIDCCRDQHVLEELGLTDGEGDDDKLLQQLDAYLCDIKEAQIRHGLHRLGELPATDKLADTLVALLRLPRGTQPESQGILHCLCSDLLHAQELAFDPLAATTQAWTGSRPALLADASDQHWRTGADTRERLELVARQLVLDCVLGQQPLPANMPATAQLLDYARQRLMAALHQSATLELDSLRGGLDGRFVPPGPSGAPTRGRLDTLPTGRNFFSVDNRSIPSTAAWALGQKSAEALLAKHLQEQGDYLRDMGLSVWGTATMRTGGDDIAQAFALMGIKPVWAPASQRVVDFEIIPAMLLGRPRVDVTLRVSGFFRDAFANVMKLYDAAVQAIAALDEPGDSNTIGANVAARQAELLATGMTAEDAARQASYRVFGSKPGAYGAGLQGLIDERCWAERSDLAEAYLNWGGYAYGNQSGDGVEARDAFASRLTHLQAVVHNQDNREHDLLDSDDYYQFQGGMSNAIETLSGRQPAIYHSDHANPERPQIRTLKEELNRVIRSRLLNPKWIAAMREHGYKGAFEMSASIDYLFAYDATTSLIADYQYQQLSDALLFDAENRQFLQQSNPAALEEMAERLLEACQRGMWQHPGEHADQLQDLLLELDEQQETAG